MNERELSLIRALGEEFSLALGELRESFRKSLSDYQQTTEEHLTRLSLEVASLKDTPAPDFTKLLADAVASLPVPETPELPDIGAMVSEAVAAIPAPQDGKSVTVDDITPFYRNWSAMPWQRYLYQRTVKTLIPPCLNRQLKKLSARR